MAYDAGDRYPDMQELADDLRAYLENRVVKAYERGAVAEIKKWISHLVTIYSDARKAFEALGVFFRNCRFADENA